MYLYRRSFVALSIAINLAIRDLAWMDGGGHGYDGHINGVCIVGEGIVRLMVVVRLRWVIDDGVCKHYSVVFMEEFDSSKLGLLTSYGSEENEVNESPGFLQGQIPLKSLNRFYLRF
jgi:hypothetical protein